MRKRQIEVMIEHLSERRRPLILMGDFNADWTGEEDALRMVAERLALRPFKPEQGDQERVTFPGLGLRLDWILISKDFRFVNYNVVKDDISDHYGITAEVERSARSAALG